MERRRRVYPECMMDLQAQLQQSRPSMPPLHACIHSGGPGTAIGLLVMGRIRFCGHRGRICLQLTMSGVMGGADGRLSCPGRWKSSRQTGQDSEGYCWLLCAAACSRRSLSISDWHLLLLLSADLFRLHTYMGDL